MRQDLLRALDQAITSVDGIKSLASSAQTVTRVDQLARLAENLVSQSAAYTRFANILGGVDSVKANALLDAVISGDPAVSRSKLAAVQTQAAALYNALIAVIQGATFGPTGLVWPSRTEGELAAVRTAAAATVTACEEALAA